LRVSTLTPRNAALRSWLALDLLRLGTGGRAIATATSTTAATTAAAALLIWRRRSPGFSARCFPRPLGARRDRHDSS